MQTKDSSKMKVLDMYMSVIKKERNKITKKVKKTKVTVESDSESASDSNSDNDMSIAVIEEAPISRKRKLQIYKQKIKDLKDLEKSEDELAFLKTFNAANEETPSEN